MYVTYDLHNMCGMFEVNYLATPYRTKRKLVCICIPYKQ